MNEESALNSFAALSHKSRLDVIRLLVKAGPDGLKAGDIATALSSSPSQTSFHLSALAESGLVDVERQARHMIYSVNFATFRDLIGFLLEDCCKGSVRAEDCC